MKKNRKSFQISCLKIHFPFPTICPLAAAVVVVVVVATAAVVVAAAAADDAAAAATGQLKLDQRSRFFSSEQMRERKYDTFNSEAADNNLFFVALALDLLLY